MSRSLSAQIIQGAFGELLVSPDTQGKSVPHFHRTHAIGVNRSGGGSLFALGKTWIYSAGMVVVTNPFDPHWGRPSAIGSDYCLLYPDPEWMRGLPGLADAAAGMRFSEAVLRDVDLASRLIGAFDRLILDRAENLLAEAVGDLFAKYAHFTREGDASGQVELVCGPTERLIAEIDSGIANLAAAAGLSRAYYSRKFRKAVGLSPLDYRRQVRVLTARSMIEAGTNLADAAATAGFADQPHMTRQFRRVLGVTPAAFRSEHKRSILDVGSPALSLQSHLRRSYET